MKFTKLDFANCQKYRRISKNETLKISFDNLTRENSAENHLATCNQIIGYLRSMADLKIIEQGEFFDSVRDIKWIKSELKINQEK